MGGGSDRLAVCKARPEWPLAKWEWNHVPVGSAHLCRRPSDALEDLYSWDVPRLGWWIAEDDAFVCASSQSDVYLAADSLYRVGAPQGGWPAVSRTKELSVRTSLIDKGLHCRDDPSGDTSVCKELTAWADGNDWAMTPDGHKLFCEKKDGVFVCRTHPIQ